MSAIGVRLRLVAEYDGDNPVYQLAALKDVVEKMQQQVESHHGTANWRLYLDEVVVADNGERMGYR